MTTPDAPYVSTGRLPPAERVGALVAEAHERFRANTDGAVSSVYPALARAEPGLFGLCVAAADGRMVVAGDAEVPFTSMSVAKPFVFALVCQELGPELVRERLGVNGTGLPFDSLDAVERSGDGRTNPMVNPGAIAAASLVPGATPDERWRLVLDTLSRFAGRPLRLDEGTYASASATNRRNRELARLLQERGRIYAEPDEAVDLYTRQSCVAVTARDLAVMGATLAAGGRNPLSGERAIDAPVCHFTLAVMTTAGLYETSGDWLYDIGVPGKSGIGGGIVAVAPGKGALGSFAPLLDDAGNSVKGQLAARFLSEQLGLDLFVSKPTA